MKVAEFHKETGFSIVEKDRPPLSPGDVRIKVEACGVCGSDRQVVAGEAAPAGTTFPLVMGHEIAGVIVELGSRVEDWQNGVPVVVYPFISCGECKACRNNQENLCLQQKVIGYQLPGGLSEEVVVPASQLIKRSSHCSAQGGALLVDAYATPYHAIKKAGLNSDHSVLVIGTGGLGLASMDLSRGLGAQSILALTRRESGLEVAREHQADDVLIYSEQSHRKIARQIRRWAGPDGIDLIIDTVGNASSFALGLDSVKTGGRYVCLGMSSEEAVIPMAKTVRRGINMIWSYGSLKSDIEELMGLVEEGKLLPTKLIAGTLPLSDVDHAFSSHRVSGRWVIVP